MKTIGMLGGMSWESTVNYYRIINEEIKKQFGGLASAKVSMYSVDFSEVELLARNGKWDELGSLLAGFAKNVEAGGADFLVLCTNTMHKLAPQIEAAINIPMLNVADATASEIKKQGFKKVGLLGTAFTMEQDFYRGILTDKYGIEVVIPEKTDREVVHKVIFGELCAGIVEDASKKAYLKIIDQLVEEGAEAIILGCTEIGMLIDQSDTKTPLLDTTVIHSKLAVEMAIQE